MQQEKVKKLKINVTNLRSALVDANKTLGEISAEKKSLLEKQVQQQRARKSGVSIGDQFGIPVSYTHLTLPTTMLV